MTIRLAEVKADSFIKLKKIFEEDDDLRLHCGLKYAGNRISGGLEVEIYAGYSKLEPKVLGLIAEHVRS